MRRTCFAAALGLAMATISPAFAGSSSAYTALDLNDKKACMITSPAPQPGEGEGSATYECRGYGDYVVTFFEGDLRSYITYGTDTADQCAVRQTFSGFNSIGNKIEWRLRDGKPIATILRWTVSYDPENAEKTKTWLVVTKLDGDEACHMGYVEGAASNANEAAQKLADDFAISFSCKTSKPIIIANSGTVTENIAANDGCQR